MTSSSLVKEEPIFVTEYAALDQQGVLRIRGAEMRGRNRANAVHRACDAGLLRCRVTGLTTVEVRVVRRTSVIGRVSEEHLMTPVTSTCSSICVYDYLFKVNLSA